MTNSVPRTTRDWLEEAGVPFQFPSVEGSRSYPVYKAGTGPGVLVLHELPGMGEKFVSLATRIRDAGFTVYAPLFFGRAGRSGNATTVPAVARLCVTREFNILATNGSSKAAPWLRSLCQHIHSECKGRGIGAIGLCLTGNIVLSLMVVDTHVEVPVMSEPAMPFHQIRFGQARARAKAALGVPDADVQCAVERSRATPLYACRFDGDDISPPERMATLERVFGEGIRTRVLATGGPGQPSRGAHSVLTSDYSDADGSETRAVLDEILTRFRERL